MDRLTTDACALAIAAFALNQPVALADENLPVWELTGTDNRVLLVGSVHFLRESDYPLPAGIMAAYEEADHLVMELDMDDLDPMAATAVMQNLGMNKDGRTLQDILGEQDYQLAAQRAEALGLPGEILQPFEPWFAALTLTQMQMMAMGFDPSWGIEAQLTDSARRDGKDIAGLETMEEQLGFLDRLDADTQAMFLAQSLEETDKIQDSLEAMVAAWRSGDEDSMADLYLEDMREAPKLFDSLLVQRNRSWVDDIRALTTKDDDYTVVVGVLHLVGEDSVLNMLADEGIKSKQLSNSDFK
jgi:uncharacterized protein YbaP (TraB family)